MQFICFIQRIQEWFVVTCDICHFNNEYNPCMFMSVNMHPRFFRLVRQIAIIVLLALLNVQRNTMYIFGVPH